MSTDRTTARPWWQRWFDLWRARGPHAAPAATAPRDRGLRAAAAEPARAPDRSAEAARVSHQLQQGLCLLALRPVPDRGEPCDTALCEATAQALQDRGWGARDIPRRPQLLPQLMHAVNDPDASARLTASIIAQDPVLTGSLLRVANSPAFRVQERPVDSLQRAVTLVGHEGIRQVISAVVVQPVMQIHCSGFPHFSAIIWEHALLASRTASDHARLLGTGDPFAAQWLGLTQGLGAALVMKQVLAESERMSAAVNPATAGQVLQQWTLPVAQRIAQAWALPEPVHRALDPAAVGHGVGASLAFARAAAAASLMCRHGVMGQSQARALLERLPATPPAALATLWRRLHGQSVETLADEQAAQRGG